MNAMKINLTLLLSLLLTSIISYAEDEQENFLAGFVLGKYYLIGKTLNDEQSYFGEIEFNQSNSKNENDMTFVKTIDHNKIEGTAKIEKTDSEGINVLRLQFKKEKKLFEQTCMVNSDLDNYARISCYLYEKNVNTDKPGLEAFFIKQD
jgi:hypothetical protein